MNRKEAHEKIKYIQNPLWKAYTKLVNSNDIEQFETDINELSRQFESEDDEEIRLFLNHMILAWWGLARAFKDGHFDS